MKSAHEEGCTRMQQMVMAALANLKRISATIDVTDAFVLICFQYLTHRLSIVVVKSSPVKERSAMIGVETQWGINKAIDPYLI